MKKRKNKKKKKVIEEGSRKRRRRNGHRKDKWRIEINLTSRGKLKKKL